MSVPDSRRRQVVVLGASLILAGAVPRLAAADCAAGPTVKSTAGPYYKPDSPQRAVLREPDMPGEPLILSGRVLDRACTPLADAVVDIWHCDTQGHYDNQGFRLRGHQVTGVDGAYRFETIVPGLYPGRTRHVHVRVTTADGRQLTTQWYFPNEPGNGRDFIYRPQLELALSQGEGGLNGRFDVVV